MAGKADPKLMLEMVMKVRSGAMSVTDAAAEMGISRDVYYKWEARALEAMLKALAGPESGRPPGPVSNPPADLLGRLLGEFAKADRLALAVLIHEKNSSAATRIVAHACHRS